MEPQKVGLESTLRASLVIFLLMAGMLKLFLTFFFFQDYFDAGKHVPRFSYSLSEDSLSINIFFPELLLALLVHIYWDY